MNISKVSVIGLGYIGLPTAAIISNSKIPTCGIDNNKDVVDTVNNGNIHITEPGLEKIVQESVESGFLKAYSEPISSDVYIITVPTPLKQDNSPDVSYVEEAIKNIAPVLNKNNLIIIESTSPIGTSKKMSRILKKLRPDLGFPHEDLNEVDINIAYCPERVIPGNTLNELVSNDRVIGGITDKCANKASNFYSKIITGKCYKTSAETAELSKLAENSFRDVNIAFANELSMICDENNINPWELIEIANKHPRVNILQPGPGVGGHCIAVDPWFIVTNSNVARLIQQAREVNLYKTEYVFKKLEKEIKNITLKKEVNEKEITVAFFGIAFKANIDDLRGSPALEIVKKTIEIFNCNILVVEPNIQELPNDIKKNSNLVSVSDAIKNCDIAISLVDHKEFTDIKKIDFNGKTLIDSKGIWN
tara:strand:- start:2809 stop:4068 length:1260 start_codon:yes stop_codon:yes gene_type:complete